MSEFATFLKIGATCLVLDLLEANQVQGRWTLRDPVSALHRVSRDWQNAQLPLNRGGQATALDIQRGYWQLAQQRVAQLPTTHFAHQVLMNWGQMLDDLAQDGPRLHQRLDWAIKKYHLFAPALRAAQTDDWTELGYWNYVIEQTKQIPLPIESELNVPAWLKRNVPHREVQHLEDYVKRHGLDWRFYVARRRLLNKLREMDFRYHDVNPQQGLYYTLVGEQNSRIERMINDDNERLTAQLEPPTDTRAWQRGQIINLAHTRNVEVEMDWDKVALVHSNNMILQMSDPFTPIQINLDRVAEFRSNKTPEIKIISVEDLHKD
jgi:proteasome accessory factor A